MEPEIHHDADEAAWRQRIHAMLEGKTRQLWPSGVTEFIQPGAALDPEQIARSGGYRQFYPPLDEATAERQHRYLIDTLIAHDATFEWAREAYLRGPRTGKLCQSIGATLFAAGIQLDGMAGDRRASLDGRYSCQELQRWLPLDDEPRANFKALKPPAAHR